jgi:N-acetylglucosamine-6-sulfatase
MKSTIAAGAVVLGLIAFAAPAVAASTPSAPNVVIIMTDDQRWDTVTSQYMPRLTNILSQNPSITYTNSFVPNSLCCPSRASTLTGDYSHTTGVYGNDGQWGGFMSFTAPPEGNSVSSVNDTTTIGVDMQNAGYRTALIGKYLNGYPYGPRIAQPPYYYKYVPPGWNRWFSVHGAVYYSYYAAKNGKRSGYFGTAPNDYITGVLSREAIRFIDTPTTKPFFLYYAPTAPHGPAIPDPRDLGRFHVRDYVQPRSFGKAEAGAPNYIEDHKWNSTSVRNANRIHKRQLNANYGVDRSIGKIWSELPDNTVVLFMSDNGFLWGEHRWNGKEVPYNESLRIPIMLVGKNLQTSLPTGTDSCPPMYSFTTSCDARIVLNIDVAPTLEGIAGVTSGHSFDGRDMLTSARNTFVLEHWWNPVRMPTYCGVRSTDWMYVRYNKVEEPVEEGLYDENADPWEMHNLAVTDPADPVVAAELQTMRDRAAILCRVDGGIYADDWPF